MNAKISSKLVPQADNLEDILGTVDAVHAGVTDDEGIGAAIGRGKVDRQGRYYRRAAESIGLLVNQNNRAVLTPRGKAIAFAAEAKRNDLLKEAVLESSLFQRVILFLERRPYGATRKEIADFLGRVTTLSRSTTSRRASSVISWLEFLGLAERRGDGRLTLKRRALADGNPIEFESNEPLVPVAPNLEEYLEVRKRTSSAAGHVQVLREAAALERANHKHDELTNLVARRLRTAGKIPRRNVYVDLAFASGDESYLFEMKSITAKNTRSQIRDGVSQLQEYRYIQCAPSAQLVLVLSDPLPTKEEWLIEYLESCQHIKLLWDGDGELHATSQTRKDLAILFP